METQVTAIVSFASLASLVAAAGLLARDLFRGRKKSPDDAASSLLRRLPLARDEQPATTLLGRLDDQFSQLVVESGYSWSPMTAVLACIACGLLAGGGLFAWFDDQLIAAIGVVLGMAVPLAYLIYLRNTRIKQILSQIPDALDLLSRAVRAGQSLDQAIELVGKKSSEPLAGEFRRCAKQLQMGLSLPAAMRALRHRLRLMEVRIFTTTLSVHRQTGGHLALTLERMAAVMRERMTYRRQVRAATAAGRFSAMLISITGPLLFIYLFLFQPEYAYRLVTLPLGQSLLIAAAVLEVIGLIWVARLLRTEY